MNIIVVTGNRISKQAKKYTDVSEFNPKLIRTNLFIMLFVNLI